MATNQGTYEMDVLSVTPITLSISRTTPPLDLGQTFFANVRVKNRTYKKIKVRETLSSAQILFQTF